MAQTAKLIDVTRTFLPVDPNAFPETLHVSGRDEGPEQRIPAMAYKGYNFMPTSYGYKSYFGTNKSIGIDAIAARVDFVFIYQNKAYENILIALTESGVWTKKGEAAGAWVNEVPVVAPTNPNTHYQWSHVIIADILYAYQQGKSTYQKFVSSSTVGVAITSIVPNFLNMVAQIGIFRAAGRLAFWDTDDSIGWANLDDFADFTPSLETLAGNAKFADIQGRITTIKAHGAGFIIYCTKSIIYIAQNIEGLFQWKPVVILPSAGVSYPFQVVEGSPDTLHFAFTSEGLKKIEFAKEETIVTEVTDFLKASPQPIYLRVLEGRYLFVELLDANYVNGIIQRSDEIVPAADYKFPGATTSIADAVDKYPNDPCMLIAGVNDGAFPDTLPVPIPADKKTGTSMRPTWTCYLSKNGVLDPANIVWTAGLCPTIDPNGVEANMSPGGEDITKLGQTSANKTAVTGTQAYLTGGWTMERFMAAQSAIWKLEDAGRKSYLSAITNRAKVVAKVTRAASCAIVPVTRSECTLGRFPSSFSAPEFGFSSCKFWLTRFALTAMDLIRVKANDATCSNLIPETFSLWRATTDWGTVSPNYIYATAEAAIAASQYAYETAWGEPHPGTSRGVYILGPAASISPMGAPLSYYVISSVSPNNGYVPANPDRTLLSAAGYDKTENMYAYNKGIDVDIPPTPDSPYCEITGWNYTKTDNTQGFVAAAPGGCTAPTNYPKPSTLPLGSAGSGNKLPISPITGAICGKPYETPLSALIPTVWPPTTVTIPAGGFFLQAGSPAPVYPTFEGALVYDLQLKKWGKMKLRYKKLLDYSPINSTLNGVVPTNVFGINAGTLRSDGKISLFDMFPSDSYISYGKIGYYRAGNTSPEEIRVDFRIPCSGYVKVETSLDGSSLSVGLTKTEVFTAKAKATLYGAYPGRWSNIEVGGIFDIAYLEYRGFTQGRR